MSKLNRINDPARVHAPLTGKVRRRPFLVTDIESKDGDTQKAGFTRPFLSGVYDGHRAHQYKGPSCIHDTLNRILRRKYCGYYIYAHNGGRFDYLHFLPVLRDMGYDFELITVGSSIQMLQVEAGHKHAPWTFVDSFKLVPISLKAAALSFKCERKVSEHDLDLHEDDPAWITYHHRDLVSLYQVVERFHDLVEDKLQGEVGVTAPATAMKTFRRSYLKGVLQRHKETHAFVREAYFGGRVEVYRKQVKAGLRYYDINSSYPHVMLEPMPVGRLTRWKGSPTKHLRERTIGFARAHVEYPEDVEFPCLPKKNEDDRLCFPVGTFSGIWSAAELMRAEEQGARVTWLDSVWYGAEPVLRTFSERLYSFRDKNSPDYEEGLAMVAKILLNSLYGKFGMREDKEKLIYCDDGVPEGCMPLNPLDEDCRVWREPTEVDAPYIIPQIAAHVTALARLNLHSFILEASRLGIVAYVDTDSLMTTADLSHLTSSKLGALKDEGAGVTYEGVFLQPKVYALFGSDGSAKVAMKGYKSRLVFDFETLRHGGSLTYETLEKVGTLARAGFKRGPVLRSVVRQIRTEDQKRIYLPDGISRPIVLREELEGVA
jgi:hypothetical protein